MARKILKNKPLVEAIFEVKWKLTEHGEGIRLDPHYKVLIGGLFAELRDEYPFHEQLPTASMPDEIAGYVAQHRFRKGKNIWPLIQIGPGILTVNDTENYTWEDFEKRVANDVDRFFAVYPDSEKLNINSLLLRYIDAIEFNYESEDIFDFLSKMLKTDIRLHPELFEGTSVTQSPLSFDWRFSFPCRKPEGMIHLRFVRGKKENSDALIWETLVQSTSDVAFKQSEIVSWLSEAHDLTDDWFFKLIKGELERRFE